MKTCSLRTIPLTSPVPVVAARAPIFKVVVPVMFKAPLTAVGFAVTKFKLPSTVRSILLFTPALLLIERFLKEVKLAPEIVCNAVPFNKIVVPVCVVNDPLLTKFPPIS